MATAVRWLWSKKPLPEIPPFKLDFKPPEVKDPAYVVEQREMSEQTGLFYFPWLAKKEKPKE